MADTVITQPMPTNPNEPTACGPSSHSPLPIEMLVDFGLANWLGLCAAGHGDLRAEMAKLTYPVPWLTPPPREGP